MRLFLGGNVPYVYRIVGPNRWLQARAVIFSVPERVKLPLKNRECRMRKHKKRGTLVRKSLKSNSKKIHLD